MKRIMIPLMIVILSFSVSAALYRDHCWSLTNGLTCINGTTGTNTLTGVSINWSNILNPVAETDSIFLSNNASIWNAINGKLSTTDFSIQNSTYYSTFYTISNAVAQNTTVWNAINTVNSTAVAAMPKTGGTFTGDVSFNSTAIKITSNSTCITIITPTMNLSVGC